MLFVYYFLWLTAFSIQEVLLKAVIICRTWEKGDQGKLQPSLTFEHIWKAIFVFQVRCEALAGRSEDEISPDHVYSMGRRRRRRNIDSTVGGEVIEATTLVKKIRIQSPDLGIIPLSSEDVIEDRNGLEKSSSAAVGEKKGLNRTFAGRRSKSTGSKVIENGTENNLVYKLDNEGYYCFGPNSLTLISGVIIFVQALLFTLALIITSRGGIKKLTSKREADSQQHFPHLSSMHHIPSISTTKSYIDSRSNASSSERRASSVESRMNFVYW